MTQLKALSPEEKVITAIACLIAVGFFLLTSKSCTPEMMGLRAEAQPQPSDESQAGKKEEERVAAPNQELSLDQDSTASSIAQSSSSTPKGENALSLNQAVSAGALGASAVMVQPNESSESPESNVEELLTQQAEEALEVQQQLEVEKESLLGDLASKDETIALLTQQQEEASLEWEKTREAKEKEAMALEAELTSLQEKVAALESSSAKSIQQDAPAAPTEEPEPAGESEEKSESVFAASDADLDESRKNLMSEIREMELLRDEALAKRYQELETTLNAKSLARIEFESGRSVMAPEQATRVSDLIPTVGKESEFLVVGFADNSGSKAGNATLSSARAKEVANALGQHVGYSRVSAIYLGQTARFGAKPENRVVEIWELKTSP